MDTDNDNDIIDVPGADAPVKKKSGRITVLDQLKEEVSKEVTRPEIEMPVPERKGVTVRFSPNITNEQLKAWRRLIARLMNLILSSFLVMW